MAAHRMTGSPAELFRSRRPPSKRALRRRESFFPARPSGAPVHTRHSGHRRDGDCITGRHFRSVFNRKAVSVARLAASTARRPLVQAYNRSSLCAIRQLAALCDDAGAAHRFWLVRVAGRLLWSWCVNHHGARFHPDARLSLLHQHPQSDAVDCGDRLSTRDRDAIHGRQSAEASRRQLGTTRTRLFASADRASLAPWPP